MPYIITTTTPDPTNARAFAPDAPAPSPMGAVRGNWPPKVSRTAVTTYEEAKAVVRDACTIDDVQHWKDPAVYYRSVRDGGTVGPLPDGTVIEVQRVSWPYLRGLTRSISRRRIGPEPDHVVAVFNAAQVQA